MKQGSTKWIHCGLQVLKDEEEKGEDEEDENEEEEEEEEDKKTKNITITEDKYFSTGNHAGDLCLFC